MTRALVAALFAALALAAPAQAAAPPPTVLDFESATLGDLDSDFYAGAGATLSAPPGYIFCGSDGETGDSARAVAPLECADVTTLGHDSLQGLTVDSGGLLEVRFAAKQASVSMWVGSGSDVTVEAWPGEPEVGERIDRVQLLGGSSPFGRAAVLKTLAGRAEIGSVRVFSGSCLGCGGDFSVDDIAFSPVEQPDTEITSGPAAVSRSADASFTFLGNQPDTGFACSLDERSVACRPPFAYTGLAEGSHTFEVRMRDRYGTVDRTPASYTWTIDLTPPPPPPPPPPPLPAPAPADLDADGVPDARDNCPASGNLSQADADADGVGDACETAPPGNVTPVTGERVIVEVLSGEVFIRLPATASSSRRFAQAAPIPGFVPLKGIAALPMGTVVDARKGRLAMQSTVDGRRIGQGGTRQSVTLAAGIFKIRQQKLPAGARTRIPTDLVLQSAPGAEAACVRTGASGPIKGRGRNTVRGLTATTAKGLFRVVGAAGITTGRDATWATADRCDGTRTDVGKGRVSVFDRAKRQTLTITAGRSYLVKAKLFAARRAG